MPEHHLVRWEARERLRGSADRLLPAPFGARACHHCTDLVGHAGPKRIFMVPFLQRVGSLLRVDSLLVHDVFGDVTAVDLADRTDASQWTLFSTSVEADPDAVADYFVLPLSVGQMSLREGRSKLGNPPFRI